MAQSCRKTLNTSHITEFLMVKIELERSSEEEEQMEGGRCPQREQKKKRVKLHACGDVPHSTEQILHEVLDAVCEDTVVLSATPPSSLGLAHGPSTTTSELPGNHRNSR